MTEDARCSEGRKVGRAMAGHRNEAAPGDVAYVRGVSLATAKAYIGPEHVAACVNAGKATGNPNEIMIKLSALDG